MLAPVMPFGGAVAHFDGRSFLHHERFPAFNGPDATVAFWVRWIQQPRDPNSIERPPLPALATIFNYGDDPAASNNTRRLILQDLTSLKVIWSGSSVDTGLKLDDSAWHHVALVLRFSDTSFDLTVYLDGRRSARGTLIHDRGVRLSALGQFVLGRRFPGDPDNPFSGEMSSFGVWKHAFEEADILSIIALEEPEPDELEVFWRLDQNPPDIHEHSPDVAYVFNDVALVDELNRIQQRQLGYFPLSGQIESFGMLHHFGAPVNGTFSVDTKFDAVPFGPLAAMRVRDSTGRLDLSLSTVAENLRVTRINAPNGFTYSLWICLDSQPQSANERNILSPVLRLVGGRLVFNVLLQKDDREIVTPISQVIGSSPLPLDKWLHIVATYNHSINLAIVYLDGKPLSIEAPNVDQPDQLIPKMPTTFQVGDIAAPFNGLISRVGVYNKPVGALGVTLLQQETGRATLATPGSDLMKRQFQNSRGYNEHTYLMAHNAHTNYEDGWWNAQQSKSVTYQLENLGVRAMELDVFPFDQGDGRGRNLYLCHGDCAAHSWLPFSTPLRLFSETLAEIARFLEKNRTEIVTVFVEWGPVRHDIAENDLVRNALRTKFLDSQNNQREVLDLVFWPDDDSKRDPNNQFLKVLPDGVKVFDVNVRLGVFKWPTIGEMVIADKRLVIFVNKNLGVDNKTPHVFPFVWRYARETLIPEQRSFPEIHPYLIYESISERNESQSRQPNRSLLRWNHFPVASLITTYSSQNRKGKLLRAAKNCVTELGLIPNFVAVDFAETGDGLKLVDQINQCWAQPDPRKALLDLKLSEREFIMDTNPELDL